MISKNSQLGSKRSCREVKDSEADTVSKKIRELRPCDILQARNHITECISILLKEKRPNASEEWVEINLPQIARKLEELLYNQDGTTFEAHSNPSTLKVRLQKLALSIRGNSTHEMGTAADTSEVTATSEAPAISNAPAIAEAPATSEAIVQLFEEKCSI